MERDGTETVLANARLVLEGEVAPGAVRIREGRIAAVERGAARPRGAVDCEGDLLAPGLVELHTDNLERHLTPRPDTHWPPEAAIVAHDAELASCGITTVFDAVRVGSMLRDDVEGGHYRRYARAVCDAIAALRGAGALRISHHLHLRAEICSQTLREELDEFAPEDRVGILSLMDHTPGQRQFRDVSKLEPYVRGREGLDEEGFARHVAGLAALTARLGAAHEAAAVAAAGRLGAALASHDDTTPAQVAASAAHGVALAEFPTTTEAARACRGAGIAVIMGAPNLVRGGSHSGNVAAAELAREGLLDILSSDYVPGALLLGAVRLGEMWGDLARGIATVTAAPARAVGLADRGRIAPGLRADLVRFALRGGVPVTRGVWSAGRRV